MNEHSPPTGTEINDAGNVSVSVLAARLEAALDDRDAWIHSRAKLAREYDALHSECERLREAYLLLKRARDRIVAYAEQEHEYLEELTALRAQLAEREAEVKRLRCVKP